MKYSCRTHGLQDTMTLAHGTVVCKKCYDEQVIGKDVRIDGKTIGKIGSISNEGVEVVVESGEAPLNLIQINS